MKKPLLTLFCLFGLLASAIARDPGVQAETLTSMVITQDLISMQPNHEYERFVLTVKGPDGVYFQQSFNGLSLPFIETYDLDGNPLPDGLYVFELRATPILSKETKAAMAEARESGDYAAMPRMRAADALPAQPLTQSGYFSIENGFIVIPELEPIRAAKTDDGRGEGARPGSPTGGSEPGGVEDVGEFDNDGNTRDQVILDDLIVDGSACIGFDCVNGEVFGFDTIRLKENNLRIKFEDTSINNFPGNDWQLTANDSVNGGANKFSIDDITGGRTPFTIEALAPSHSLYVDDGGRIGLGTSIPAVDLHIIDGDSPTLRLQQDGSSGFAPQTWDVAGNETNFFIRDASNGSTLPFRIRPGAPTSSIYIHGDGKVGLGTTSPDEQLHVEGGNLTVQDNAGNIGGSITAIGEDSALAVTRDSGTTNSGHQIATFTNNGSSLITLENSATANNWFFGANAANFIISKSGTGGEEVTVFPGGNMTILGNLTQGSDVNIKDNILPIEPAEVLNKVLDLPISSWSYITDETGSRHLGPMAQDFYAAFQLGHTETGISSIDSAGVALGAIQGLHHEIKQIIEQKDATIQALQEQLQQQETRLQALEKALLK